MRGIQLRSVGNTNDHIIFWTRSTSTAVETISVYSEEWITPHLLQSSNRVLPEFVNVESIGSGYALQTLDSTSSLQDFSKICIFFINLDFHYFQGTLYKMPSALPNPRGFASSILH